MFLGTPRGLKCFATRIWKSEAAAAAVAAVLLVLRVRGGIPLAIFEVVAGGSGPTVERAGAWWSEACGAVQSDRNPRDQILGSVWILSGRRGKRRPRLPPTHNRHL